MEKISAYQLFILTYMFQIGTTTLFGFGTEAGRDAWLATLLSSFLGSILILLYIGLMKMNPGLTLVEWFPHHFGKVIGIPLAWLYPLIFLFDAGRIVGDLRDLIPTTLLPTTPPIMFNTLFLVLVAFGLYLGIESLARVGEIIFPLLMFLLGIEIILLFSSQILNFNNFLPFMEKGFSRVWKATFPVGILQTYGETIALAMIWTQASNPKSILKVTLIASLISGVLLALSVGLTISAFGEELYMQNIYPIYHLHQVIDVADFINNLNVFGVIYFTTTIFFKLYIKAAAGLIAIQYLTRMKDYRPMIIPAMIIILFIGLTVSENVIEHIYELSFKYVNRYVWFVLFIILPFLLFVVSTIRHKRVKE
ncbi:GerAB/ArcD/ProY family transporter [Halobacillus sp. A5]|uniref:GerAB/ArcD/ProY family transporter n=1 Tax=Halobacillus sp. A5 TaxID=2880263 RepID=UPI0020A661DE|nr:GerAB/ArcD/ProY family transporter [Halobacillus sp. A5]MCP3028797.1 spore germination protein [Halobacillus sp. A5]